MKLIQVPIPLPLFRFLCERLGFTNGDAPLTIEVAGGPAYKLKAKAR